jgi:hypothetical protein
VLAAGCNYTPGAIATGDASTSGDDAAVAQDARLDAPPGSACVGSGLFMQCYPPGTTPTGTRDLSSDIDTGSDCDRIGTQTGGPDMCIIEAAAITVSDDVGVRGPRPLVLIAIDSIIVDSGASLDFSSNGAAPDDGCTATAGTDDTSSSTNAGAAGGGGGSFGGAGAGGGAIQSDAAGGNTGATLPLTAIRGGCAGADGGDSSDGDGGRGGDPGGALYLAAGASITIDGNLFANGDGGGGGAPKAGGGGGGSGGLIALDAPVVTLDDATDLVANGGAGGEGGGGTFGGYDGQGATSYDSRPDGGFGNVNGSNGGDGAYDVTIAPTPGDSSGEGGGGGGAGFGYIRVFATSQTLSDRISPAAP